MSDPVGPVCHIPSANPAGNPQAATLPGLPGPAQANVASLTGTVNQLLNVVRALLNQPGTQGPQRTPDNSNNNNPGSFTQQDVQRNKVKVYQNNDPSTGNFVEVDQVTKLVMGNKAGATWTYNAPPQQ